ncbi:O-methyltransferase [Luteibaculum oceani]|uniref:O-methyltransferase n=1 Tax=Luteibaculum oceani TaxID=1294296 RepID=A0A5C6V0R0_9FLAO|nr:O-methyltransferase [Luteibaculum oceani]TXC78450.1 O-methyltransferase [Luteibaculum oceani]
MEFLDNKLQEYANNHSSKEPQLLYELNRETYQKVLQPRMLSGHFQGRLLSMISHMLKPKNILEIGTYTGYSALCMAEGLQKGGELHTIDLNDELQPYLEKYFGKSEFGNQIKMHWGNALEIIPKIKCEFDLVFIDADKENYSAYLEIIWDKLPVGAHILADNVLWSGKVLEPAKPKDKDTIGLQRFNKEVAENPKLEKVLLPIRDGLFLMRKIKD